MSTVATVVKRPESAPKEPVYPRLVTFTNGKPSDKVVVFALGNSKDNPTSDFRGVVVSAGTTLWKVGEYYDNFTKSMWSDFNDAVLLFNK